MFGMGMGELMVVLVISLVIFGPSKLQDIAKNLGRSVTAFKKGIAEAQEGGTPIQISEQKSENRKGEA
jgi:TatA/E family protein of Tat protein translocase